MSTIVCDCCQQMYASHEVKYYIDKKEYYFCEDCRKQHTTSPAYPGRAIKNEETIVPRHQDFPYENKQACTCCQFIRKVRWIRRADGSDPLPFCDKCAQLQPRADLQFGHY